MMFKKALSFAFALILLPVAILLTTQLVLADQTNALIPTSDGAFSDWSTKSGNNHVAMVDEASCNGNTDYNYTTATGKRDSYVIDLNSIPDGATINEIRIIPCSSKHKNGSGTVEMDVFYRLNGVNSQDAGNYMLSSATPSVLTATSFTGLSVAKSSSTSLEVGAVYSAGNKGVRLSKVEAVVVYSLPPTPTPTPTPPAILAPSDVTVTTVGCDVPDETSLVEWQDNSDNEMGFELQRSDISDAGPFYPLASIAANTTFSDDQATPSGCFYRVRGFNSTDFSEWAHTEVIQ